MLIIPIIMILRKKHKLRVAYAFLAVTTASVLAYDWEHRSRTDGSNAESHQEPPRRTASALPMVPLAQSPFREASLESFLASQSAVAHQEPKAKAPRDHRIVPSGVYFLKVAMQVPAKDGPLTLNRGTRVHLVREQDGKLRVRRNSTDFLIDKSQVTDDLNELGTLARNSS